MLDLHLRHTLKQLARDAAGVFDDLLSDGQEIPYEIAEPGDSRAFCQYQPLTAKFVRDNATELRQLDSFREATETMRRSDIAASYLENAEITPPADAVERATLAVTYFLARLWDGCSDFELEEQRFSATLAEIEECSEPEAGEVEAIVPLVGLRADATRIELGDAAIVRADTVDVPPEASRGAKPDGGEWEPSFLISAMIDLDPEGGLAGAGERVAQTFERVVTTLRLYKRGGVALGPYGWVRVAGDRWRRIATGAGRPRGGGYQLAAEETGGLADLARTISVHPRRVSRLRRALLRFESGLDRRGAIDALNDHLLGLRFLLEGDGPAGVGMPMRAAALAADGEKRLQLKETVEEALSLERELWSGEPSGESELSPSQVATGIEDLLRTILSRAVAGELGSDIRAAADETLLADGLAVGESAATRGGTSEWQSAQSEEPDTTEVAAADAFEQFDHDHDAEVSVARGAEPEPESKQLTAREVMPVIEDIERQLDRAPKAEIEQPGEPDREAEQPVVAPEPSREPRAPRQHPIPFGSEPERQLEHAKRVEQAENEDTPAAAAESSSEPADELSAPDWLEEVDDGDGVTMSFPPREGNHLDELSRPPMEREEVRARVEYLFPRTETDWTVGQDSTDTEGAAAG